LILSSAALFGIDTHTVFFGGRGWSNCQGDLRGKEWREYFVLCLFGVVVNDLNMHAHFRPEYSSFRARTMYPKFGWTGFGVHWENPRVLLTVPVEKGLIDMATAAAEVPGYVEYWYASAETFLHEHTPQIPAESFFRKMTEDKWFQVQPADAGSLFGAVLQELRLRLPLDR
jgi:hypothetical protein